MKAKVYYLNAKKSKYNIYNDNKHMSGIYPWTNKETKESYIGSSINLTSRLRSYYSFKNLKKVLLRSNSKINSIILKYDHSNFSLEILEYCDAYVLDSREQYYINKLNPEYNIRKKVGSRIDRKYFSKTLNKLKV